ncbi:MAG TPA: Nre family DNA repair protein [Thermoplasmata archaeon]|nr:Nre family DNA repair protein [Thermoplasmata archaeon]
MSGRPPPFPGIRSHDQIAWSIPGLENDPTMCLRCRAAQMLCGKPVCPILVRHDALMKTIPLIEGKELDGSSPPSVFIGRYGYPKVAVGPLLTPQHGDTLLLDTPEAWVGRPVAELVGFRTSLVRGTQQIRVTDAEKPQRAVEDLQLLARAEGSAEAEATFRRPPRGRIALSDTAPPFGPSAPLDHMRIDVRRVDARVDRLYSDTDATARVGVEELYGRSVPVSRIQRAFSAGTLGRRGHRRFVPTRWSITAVDDLLGRANLLRVRSLPELSEITVFRLTALDNRWLLIFLPGSYRYESIEAWYPNTFWNPNTVDVVVMGDHEGFRGRKSYAAIGGCYYAARLATSEALLKMQRQAGVLVLREVHPGEVLPLGVWNVREHVRAALQTKPVRYSDRRELYEAISAEFAIPLPRWLTASALLHEERTQRKLEEYDRSAEFPAGSLAAFSSPGAGRPDRAALAS